MSAPYPPEYPPSEMPPSAGYPTAQTPAWGTSSTSVGPTPQPGPYAPPSAYPPPPGYPPAGYAPGYAPVGTRGNSGWAIASLVVGLVGLCPLINIAGVAAVILGHIGLNEINRSGGRLGSKGLAVGGLILGYIEILWFVVANLNDFFFNLHHFIR